MKYAVSQWEKCWVEYQFVVEADSPEHALEQIKEGKWEQCQRGDIDGIGGEVDDEATEVREIS